MAMTDDEFAARMAQFKTNPDLRTETEIYLSAQLEKARESERTIWQALEIRLRSAVKDFPTEFPGTWGSMLNAVHLVAGSYRENPFTVRARAIEFALREAGKITAAALNLVKEKKGDPTMLADIIATALRDRLGPSRAPAQQQHDDHNHQDRGDAGGPVAVAVPAPRGESTDGSQEQNHHENPEHGSPPVGQAVHETSSVQGAEEGGDDH